MRAMVKTTIGKCALVLATTFTLLSCSDNGDTVVAVNFAFDDSAPDVKSNADTLHIKVGTAETDFTISRNDKGEITSGSWKRMVVNGMRGTVTVTITAKDKSGTTLLEVSQNVVLVEHGATEVFLKLSPNPPEPPPGATGGSTGAGGTGVGGSGGGGSGAGGIGAGSSGSGGATT
jgi:uncharacterized membrane protein YgcG